MNVRRWLIAASLFFATAGSGWARQANVDSSIARGRDYLYSTQTPEGTWEVIPKLDPASMKDYGSVKGPQFTGRTALAAYALLKAGVKPGEPRLAKAIDFLKKSPSPTGTYALALRCLVWESLPLSDETKRLAKRDADRLLIGASQRGMNSYVAGMKGHDDLSNSQIAALGIFTAGEMGVEIPTVYWRQIDRSWRERQLKDGSWNYAPDQPTPEFHSPHAGMTAAGLVTLLQAREATATVAANLVGNENDKNIAAAEKWLTANFNSINGFKFFVDRTLYILYMVERAGVAGGIKRFGDNIWYERGAEWLIGRQRPDGSWVGGVTEDQNGVVDTSFALMFLSNARAPVLVSKIKYTTAGKDGAATEGHWNQRSRDVARVVRWAAAQAEALNRWQVIDLDGPAADFFDARALYLAGDQPLVWNETQKAKLKDAIDRGALLICSADNKNKPFADSVEQIGREIYPQAVWRDLPADHPILKSQQFNATRWKKPISLRGLSNGTRDLIVLVPEADLARTWMAGFATARAEPYELGANLIQYAGEVGSLIEKPAPPPPAKSKAVIARLPLGGEEARAWPAFTEWAAGQGIAASVAITTLSANSISPTTRLVHVPVRDSKSTLTPAQVTELKRFLDARGNVLIEAIGGTTEAADAARALATQLAGDAPPIDLATLAMPPLKISLRPYAANAGRTAAEVVAKKTKAGGTVVVCPVDCSAALAGLRHNGIIGLTADSARSLVAALANDAPKP